MPTVTKQTARWYQAGDFGIFVSTSSAPLDQATNLTYAITTIAAAGGGILEFPVGTVNGAAAGV